MKITLEHESGVKKEVKKGFSWTTFFFGFLVPLIRGDIKWAAIMFIVAAVIALPTFGLGVFLVDLVFAFIYNKTYAKELLEKGYRPSTERDEELLKEYGVFAA
ncbi:hypothetical protein [Tindallia californiensis]|uniref:DUF2628 domain-containing protein n=1 Tax=Tindallia californiensis TaxID=159292 RepID=A0A1H3Q2F7_9FIRM|nr:hypothetical protein [Tindallia californiensis]SDZ07722.1 hypothetical protein SAMN05192546_10846 [Tindallia californiensis]